MKKYFNAVCGLLFLLFLVSTANAQFSFKITGGLNYLGGGEFNDGAKGFGDTWVDLFSSEGLTGEFAPAHLGLNFGGEFIYQITPSIGVGLGVGYLAAGKESTITYAPHVAGVDFYWKSSLSAIPITANFYYFVPAGGNLKFFFNLGAGYYIAKADYLHYFALFVPAHQDAKTTGGGLGFHGGVGLEFDFNPTFGLVCEFKGRYASFSNFEGDVIWTYPWSPGDSDTLSGKLWAQEVDGRTWLWIDAAAASGGDNPRQAKVDFSGFSFVIGVVIHI